MALCKGVERALSPSHYFFRSFFLDLFPIDKFNIVLRLIINEDRLFAFCIADIQFIPEAFFDCKMPSFRIAIDEICDKIKAAPFLFQFFDFSISSDHKDPLYMPYVIVSVNPDIWKGFVPKY